MSLVQLMPRKIREQVMFRMVIEMKDYEFLNQWMVLAAAADFVLVPNGQMGLGRDFFDVDAGVVREIDCFHEANLKKDSQGQACQLKTMKNPNDANPKADRKKEAHPIARLFQVLNPMNTCMRPEDDVLKQGGNRNRSLPKESRDFLRGCRCLRELFHQSQSWILFIIPGPIMMFNVDFLPKIKGQKAESSGNEP